MDKTIWLSPPSLSQITGFHYSIMFKQAFVIGSEMSQLFASITKRNPNSSHITMGLLVHGSVIRHTSEPHDPTTRGVFHTAGFIT